MKLSIVIFLTVLVGCFSKSVDPSSRIVGGNFAEKNQFPHQVAIIYKGNLRCGGSIVSSQYVVTAAHCVVDGKGTVSGLSILAGTNSLRDDGVKVDVLSSTPHEDYGNFMNDIALMKLKEPLKFSESIKPIQFATKEIPEGANVTIAGWGKVSSWGSISEKLKFNTLKAVGQNECARAAGIDFEGLLCLGHSSNNGACNGDSGGSAIYDGKLVGVANFIVFYCGSENPDGYAKVSWFADWIDNIINK